MITPTYQMADGIVVDWSTNQRIKVDQLDLTALRTSIAQGFNLIEAEKNKEIEALKARLAAVNVAVVQGLQGSDRA